MSPLPRPPPNPLFWGNDDLSCLVLRSSNMKCRLPVTPAVRLLLLAVCVGCATIGHSRPHRPSSGAATDIFLETLLDPHTQHFATFWSQCNSLHATARNTAFAGTTLFPSNAVSRGQGGGCSDDALRQRGLGRQGPSHALACLPPPPGCYLIALHVPRGMHLMQPPCAECGCLNCCPACRPSHPSCWPCPKHPPAHPTHPQAFTAGLALLKISEQQLLVNRPLLCDLLALHIVTPVIPVSAVTSSPVDVVSQLPGYNVTVQLSKWVGRCKNASAFSLALDPRRDVRPRVLRSGAVIVSVQRDMAPVANVVTADIPAGGARGAGGAGLEGPAQRAWESGPPIKLGTRNRQSG
jgi:hypothetical protein